MTKKEIFDKYAQEQGFPNWLSMIKEYDSFLMSIQDVTNHIFKATDLVCKQALENASENIFIDWSNQEINKQSITNSENIPK